MDRSLVPPVGLLLADSSCPAFVLHRSSEVRNDPSLWLLRRRNLRGISVQLRWGRTHNSIENTDRPPRAAGSCISGALQDLLQGKSGPRHSRATRVADR